MSVALTGAEQTRENLLLLLIQFHNYKIVNCEAIHLTIFSIYRKTVRGI